MDAWDEAQREVDKMRAKDSDMAEKLEKKITAVCIFFCMLESSRILQYDPTSFF